MLRRKPTRIELKQEDIEELVAVRKEHMEQQKQVSLFAKHACMRVRARGEMGRDRLTSERAVWCGQPSAPAGNAGRKSLAARANMTTEQRIRGSAGN